MPKLPIVPQIDNSVCRNLFRIWYNEVYWYGCPLYKEFYLFKNK